MKQPIRRGLSLFLTLVLVLSLFPVFGGISTVSAANLSTDIYQLPSKTLNDAGTKYRQNMSYIIRTRNGKIIVIDGGYSTDNQDANYLISQLQSITGKDVPNVDAWFFTHDHSDHVGAFKAIAARMPTKVTVTAVYYRFPTDAEIDKYAPESSRDSLKTSTQSFRNHVKLMKKADGTPTDTVTVSARHVNRCNATFNIDTVQLDVLLTCQETFWGCDNITTKYSGNLSNNGKSYSSQTIQQLVEADFGNSTSMVFRLTTAGKTAIFLGDASEPTGLVLRYFHEQHAANSNKYFSLKSDIVQMAHHGQNGVPKNVYTAIDPDIALWPCPDWVYTPSSSSELTTSYTKQWMSALGTTNYVSKDGLKKISLSDLRTDVQPTIPEEMKPLIFDAAYYGNKYPDVYNAFSGDPDKMYNHFLKYGIEEGRCASPYFDIRYYMSQNSAKMADHCKGDYEKGLDHFLKYAYEEGELTGGGAKKLSPIFDCKYYYNAYPILKELGLKNEFEILQYFVTTGQAAGHKGAADVKTLNGGVVYHTVSPISSIEATCTTAGKTAGEKCATCGIVLKAQTTVEAKGHSYTDTVTPPTCTEAGYTTHTCTLCGNVAVDSQTEATGHRYTETVTPPTCTEAGYTTHTCGTCGHTYRDSEREATGHSYTYEDLGEEHRASCTGCNDTHTAPHSFTEGLCICGTAEILTDKAIVINHSLNLASDISVNFAISAALLKDYDSYTLEVTIPIYDRNDQVGTKVVTIPPTLNGNYYYFTLSGLTAVQINDVVEATLRMTKGGRTYVSDPDCYSIATYAYNQLNKASATTALKKMCADLLQYGSKAQLYKNYRTEALAEAAMTDAHKAYLTDPETVPFGNTNRTLEDIASPTVTWAGKSLNLESKVVVRFIADLSAYEGSPEDLTLKVTYRNVAGETVTAVVGAPVVFNASKKQYAFDFTELLAAELRTVLSAAVYEGETQVSPTIEYSVDTYCNNKTGTLGALCKAMMAYSDSAKAFFAK